MKSKTELGNPDWYNITGVKGMKKTKPSICPYCHKTYTYLTDEMQYMYNGLVFCGYICRQKFKREHPFVEEDKRNRHKPPLTEEETIDLLLSNEKVNNSKLAYCKKYIRLCKKSNEEPSREILSMLLKMTYDEVYEWVKNFRDERKNNES